MTDKNNVNLQVYEGLAYPSEKAVSAINGGKLNNFSSVNTQWRIEKLTEMFGPYGIGWYIDEVQTDIDASSDLKLTVESKATCSLKLYVKFPGQTDFAPAAIGIGGAPRVSIFSKKAEFSDECYKCAYSDALSYAGRLFGLAGSIYTNDWSLSPKKYEKERTPEQMKNLEHYYAIAMPEPKYVKPIEGGKLKGLSSVNTQWRYKKMTEYFGPYGLGWYVDNVSQWLEDDPCTNESKAYVSLDLYVKYPGTDTWSKAAHGIGGSARISQFKTGVDFSDECFKCAYTDAFSFAARFFGLASSVYLESDTSKYSKDRPENVNDTVEEPHPVSMEGFEEVKQVASVRRKPGLLTEETEKKLRDLGAFDKENIAWMLKALKLDNIDNMTERQALSILAFRERVMKEKQNQEKNNQKN